VDSGIHAHHSSDKLSRATRQSPAREAIICAQINYLTVHRFNLQVDRFSSIAEAFFSFATAHPDSEAYSQASEQKDQPGISATYGEVSARISSAALALGKLGVKRGSAVAILSGTRPEWMEADLSILACGGITACIYQSLPASDVGYILFDSKARIVFAENQEQVDKLLALHKKKLEVPATEDRPGQSIEIDLQQIIAFEAVRPHELVRSWSEFTSSRSKTPSLPSLTQDDVAALVYTSGTTGPPKGVIQTHGNHLANVRQSFQCGMVDEQSSLTLFLPLAHSFARLMAYIGFLSSVRLAFPAVYEHRSSKVDPTRMLTDIRKLNSQIVPVVPRFLEKMKEGIEAKCRERNARGALLRICLKAAKAKFLATKAGRAPTLSTMLAFKGTAGLRKKISIALFGDRFRFAVSGGAKLPLDVAEYFAALGIVVLEGYGLTETCVATNVNPLKKNKLGTVGPVLAPDIELRLSEEGEILFRGPNIAKGYFERPTATGIAWDQEGWFHTGDLGSLDADNYLSIVGRKKEIIVTSGGKKIAPLGIENQLSSIELVSQALLIGDERPFCVALLTLDKQAATHWLAANESSVDADQTIRNEIWSQVDRLNQTLSSFETIKNILILKDEFTVENGLLTPTFKIRRNAVVQKFAAEIERLYRETSKPSAS